MADQRPRPGSDESIDGLLNDIRGVRTESGDVQHRYFGKRQAIRQPGDAYNESTCQCGNRKLPSTPRCPACAFEAGHIDEPTKQKLLAMLDGAEESTAYGSRTCQCGEAKIPSARRCKACAVQLGTVQITVEPGEEPCPMCGDGRKPAFALCTGCATAAGYLDQNRQVSADCPNNQCQCGDLKPAAFTRCRNCVRGITGYRNQDWTTGPNPVKVFNPLPSPEAAQPQPAEFQLPTTGEEAPCWRCSNPVAADKRFCMDCIIAMGAPAAAYDESFNERPAHEG